MAECHPPHRLQLKTSARDQTRRRASSLGPTSPRPTSPPQARHRQGSHKQTSPQAERPKQGDPKQTRPILSRNDVAAAPIVKTEACETRPTARLRHECGDAARQPPANALSPRDIRIIVERPPSCPQPPIGGSQPSNPCYRPPHEPPSPGGFSIGAAVLPGPHRCARALQSVPLAPISNSAQFW